MKLQTLLKQTLLSIGLLAGAADCVKAQYCVPAYVDGCSMDDDINDFSIAGAGTSTLSDLGTGCSSGAYHNLSGSMSVTLEQGGVYQAFISSTYYDENAQVYIDFNNDGSFSSAESVGGTGGIDDIGVNFNLYIPQTAAAGSHRMRVVLSYDYAYPNISPCPTVAAGYEYGEVHDYTAVIQAAAGPFCDAPAAASASSVTDVSAALHWLPVTGAIGYEYLIDQTQTAPMAAGTAISTNNYAATGLTANTVYFLHVRSKCGPATFSPWTSLQFVTTAAAPSCPDPGGFTVTALTGTSATLGWTAAAGNPDYEVFVSEVFLYPLSGTVVSTNSAGYINLMPNTTHYAWLRRHCSPTSYSDWAVLSFTTTGTAGPAPTSVYGNLYAGNASVPSTDTYKVWLIQYNAATNSLTAVDSESTDYGGYYFNGMPAGDYLVKAAQLTAGTAVLGQVPTYRDSSLYWASAMTVPVSGPTANQHIWMRQGTVTSGPGFIGGNVSLGANKGTGSGVPDLLILLRDASGRLVKAAYTNSAGDYSFGDLPLGSYSVYPELMPYATTAWASVSLSAAQPGKTEVSFNKDDNQMNIKPRTSTGLLSVTARNAGFLLSPNPARSELRINLQSAAGTCTATVSTLSGQAVLRKQFTGTETALDVSQLPAGLYNVRVRGEGLDAVQKLVVQP